VSYSQQTIMEAITLLHRVKARLQQGWCQGHYAINSNGRVVSWDDSTAVAWCFSGAMNLESYYSKLGEFSSAREIANKAIVRVMPNRYRYIERYNDDIQCTAKQVIGLVDQAIEYLARQKGECA